ncbi:MAG: NADH dehydrogenase [archaeon GW2011_AR3]|nr:MAG: NADH dehydrogenase [archaeon GW2011_AR3]MBS3108967.1 FAD-dependent oxidoreductase [Candidatus Woesearchaeota archaeon]
MAKIVILGGGFAGMHAARKLLANLDQKTHKVVMISKHSDFVFTPLLPEVEIGLLEPSEVTQDIPSVLRKRNFEFRKAEIKSVDFEKKIVHTDAGDENYDFLFISMGSVINKSAISHLKIPDENVYCLKNINDSLRILNKINDLAAKYEASASARKQINIVFVGAGATAIEVAGEIRDHFKRHFARAGNHEAIKDVHIHMLEKSGKILPQVPDSFRDEVLSRLKSGSIEILYNSKILSYEKGRIEIETAEGPMKLGVSLFFLSAGVNPAPCDTGKSIKDGRGCIVVDEHLQVKGVEDAWAAGDIACINNPKDGTPVPMQAQSAVSGGKIAGFNIIAKIMNRPQLQFSFESKGFLLSVGQGNAVGEIFGRIYTGYWVWWLKRTVYCNEFFGIWCKMGKFFSISLFSIFRKK